MTRAIVLALIAASGLMLSALANTDASVNAPAALANSETADPVIRRQSRAEYANSLRDLFGMDFTFVAELPPDGQAGGFDNIADAMALSPLLLEGYLKVARKVSN